MTGSSEVKTTRTLQPTGLVHEAWAFQIRVRRVFGRGLAVANAFVKPLLALALLGALAAQAAPISLHPDNPHYFLFRGEPAVLITSAEHYGAVLNRDFDYVKYLDTLAADGLNLTRTFTGAYVEPEGAFNIAENTLAPKPGRFICPWVRSDQPGYANGGNKFDLTKWDEEYFARLKDFVVRAGERGVVVELALFCPMYEDKQWALSPMNVVNNVNGIGKVGKHDVHNRTKNGDLQALQEQLVRRIVVELRDADNVMYEICNEPYFGGVTMDWQHRIADVIVEAEKDFPQQHLITQNIANGSAKIDKPHPAVSVFNFHYAHPPDAVGQNYALNKVIGDNETGFKGTADDHYRMEAWEFILAGGGLFNNLDYSFTAGHEDGTFHYPPKQPGGGNPGFRKQMKALKEFIHSFDFLRMKPARDLVKAELPKGARVQCLAEPGKQYAVYLKTPPARIGLELPGGSYAFSWMACATGERAKSEQFGHPGGVKQLDVPAGGELALRLVRAQE